MFRYDRIRNILSDHREGISLDDLLRELSIDINNLNRIQLKSFIKWHSEVGQFYKMKGPEKEICTMYHLR